MPQPERYGGFEVVDPDDAPPARPPESASQTAALSMIMLGLKTLGQRTLVALDNLFTLITVGLVFWLFMSVPEPNTHQLVGLGIFCTFVLVANWIVRQRK